MCAARGTFFGELPVAACKSHDCPAFGRRMRRSSRSGRAKPCLSARLMLSAPPQQFPGSLCPSPLILNRMPSALSVIDSNHGACTGTLCSFTSSCTMQAYSMVLRSDCCATCMCQTSVSAKHL